MCIRDSGRVDVYLEDGDTIDLDGETIRVIHTPGHTRGGVCYFSEKSKVVFTGDTIFNVDIGRTDFEDGSPDQMERSILDLSLIHILQLLQFDTGFPLEFSAKDLRSCTA